MRGILSLLGVVTALAGCSGTTTQALFTGYDDVAKVEFMQYAGAKTPVYMMVLNTPFEGGNTATAERAASESDGVLVGINVSFTAEEDKADQSHFFVVHLFSPVGTMSANRICKMPSEGPPEALVRPTETVVMSAFCARDEAIAASISRISTVSGLDDPTFRVLMREALRTMFSANDPRYDHRSTLLVAQTD